MKTLLLSALILLSLTGCYEKDNKSYHFEWATVNSRLIETELLKIAKKQNPYPDDINIDINQLRTDSRNLSNQINILTRTAKNKCFPENKPSNEKKIPRPSRYPNAYNNECFNKINSDPLISDLKAKKEKLDAISRRRSMHDRKVREYSRKYVNILIGKYSKNKFEIVINNHSRNILYNDKGLSIDITEAILNQIREKEPKITIQ